jgi:hypothetical protein
MWPFKKRKPKDGTFWITGNGVVTEGWADPKRMSELLRGAERDGKATRVVRVLIKGYWDGVREQYWDFDQFGDQVDADGCMYAMCVLEDGVPKYHAMNKKAWVRYDEILKVMGNIDLSDEDRRQRVQAIMNRE